MRIARIVSLVVAVVAAAPAWCQARADQAKVAEKEVLWVGKLKAGEGINLTIVLHVNKDEAGGLVGKFDSPDQGANGLKVDSVTVDKEKLSFEVKLIAGTFDGKLNADGTEAVGTWSQGGAQIPLTLKKTDKLPAVNKIEGKEQLWEGKLNAGGVELPLVLHVGKDASGATIATFDSPSQGARGLKVESVVLDKEKLSFEMPTIAAKFDGKLNKEGTEAVGTWSQAGGQFDLTLKKTDKAPDNPKIQGKEQVWEGKLDVGGISLRLVFRMGKDADGATVAALDSPDQGAKGIRVESVNLDKDRLSFEAPTIAGKFSGAVNAEGTEAVGNWEQAGSTFPLTLKKTDKPSEVRRPQTPKPPFPYASEAVAYINKAGGVSLAGTLTTPTGAGPFPAVILISGSGAQDRDESLFEHKPFMVIADDLTRKGVAVLRVDDRGVGGSSGSISTSTSEDFAGDVLAGVAFLRSRPEIDKSKIGLIGHSEGGIIAPMVAAKSDEVAFIVLLAGTGLPGDEILKLQARLILKASGLDGEVLDRRLETQARLIDIAMNERDETAAASKMREVIETMKKSLPEKEAKEIGNLDKVIDGQLKSLRSAWFRYFLSYDPRPTLAKVRCPLLAVVGEMDLQVPPKENLGEIARVLKEAGNSKASVKELAGLNHLFQTCQTGAPAEYAQIEETISPSALEVVANWIAGQVR